MLSQVKQLNKVVFPKHIMERLYQVPFTMDSIPSSLWRWDSTIRAMLEGIEFDGNAYFMVDQAHVKAGTTHRRGGLHIDGNWVEERCEHGVPPRHCTSNTSLGLVYKGRHLPTPGPSWDTITPLTGGIVLASDISACRAVIGEYDFTIGEGGDCSGLDVSNMDSVLLKPNTTYLGNVTLLHESIPVVEDCDRTLVRITLPNTFKYH